MVITTLTAIAATIAVLSFFSGYVVSETMEPGISRLSLGDQIANYCTVIYLVSLVTTILSLIWSNVTH